MCYDGVGCMCGIGGDRWDFLAGCLFTVYSIIPCVQKYGRFWTILDDSGRFWTIEIISEEFLLIRMSIKIHCTVGFDLRAII
jgi:hypothetical protein